MSTFPPQTNEERDNTSPYPTPIYSRRLFLRLSPSRNPNPGAALNAARYRLTDVLCGNNAAHLEHSLPTHVHALSQTVNESNEIVYQNCIKSCLYYCLWGGEWSKREWWRVTYIHLRELQASLLVNRLWRSHIGCQLQQSSHSTAEQSTIMLRSGPHRHRLSGQLVVAHTIVFQ